MVVNIPPVNKYRDNNKEVQFKHTPPPHMDDEGLCHQPRGRYTHWRQYQYARWRIIRFVNIFKNHLLKKNYLYYIITSD